MMFIEFRNGAKPRFTDIRDKVGHTLLILGELIDLRLDEARDEIAFILVYNEQAVFGSSFGPDTGDETADGKRSVQASPQRSALTSAIRRKGEVERRFDSLRRMLEGYCCVSVKAYTAGELERNFLPSTSHFA